MNPAAIPSTRCGPPCPCVSSGADAGSSATIRAAQPPAFSAFDTPAIMPAVPTAPQNACNVPPVCSINSRPMPM